MYFPLRFCQKEANENKNTKTLRTLTASELRGNVSLGRELKFGLMLDSLYVMHNPTKQKQNNNRKNNNNNKSLPALFRRVDNSIEEEEAEYEAASGLCRRYRSAAH